MRPDVVVAGGGLAGMTAAVTLAEAGASVLVVAKGAGSMGLSAGTIDVLGYDPGPVERPLDAIGVLAGARPEHPYARLGVPAVRRALTWLLELGAPGTRHGSGYVGTGEVNHLISTAVGVPKPTALVPSTMAAGDLRTGAPVLVAGLRGLKDFHAALIADNLRALGLEARAVVVDAPAGAGGDTGTLTVARAFDVPERRQAFASAVRAEVRAGERIALPAVLGLADPAAVWEEIQAVCGAPVFEVPTLPPSVPGIRLSGLLRTRLRTAGGRLILGTAVVGAERDGSGLRVRLAVSGGERQIGTDHLVLATGGVLSGGIELRDDGSARETALGLPVSGSPGPGRRAFSSGFFDEHPFSRAGIVVDDALRPVGPDGEPLAAGVRIAGALLGGAEPWKEKSGDGLALASGHRAAELILAELGASVAEAQGATIRER